MVLLVEEEDEEEGGGKAVDFCGGPGGEVEAVVVFKEARCGALPRCVLSRFPPPFCVGLCLTTFSSSIWVSAVPCARPKSTRAYLQIRQEKDSVFKEPITQQFQNRIKTTGERT